MKKIILNIDKKIIFFLKKNEIIIARLSIFIVYFYFGLLKLLGFSPATSLVKALFEKTLSQFIQFSTFYNLFSIFEMLIGIMFLIKGLERVAIFLLMIHLIMTILPLFLLPDLVWQNPLIPTLEGQYIIKNILLFALAVVIGSKLVQLK